MGHVERQTKECVSARCFRWNEDGSYRQQLQIAVQKSGAKDIKLLDLLLDRYTTSCSEAFLTQRQIIDGAAE